MGEKKRIEDRGGEISFHKGCWRINKNLSVTRAFGDVSLKKGDTPLIDAEPDLAVQSHEQINMLCVASDGVWHLIDNEPAVKILVKHQTAQDACLALFKDVETNTRSQLKGHDNTTAVTLYMRHGSVPVKFREQAPQPEQESEKKENSEKQVENDNNSNNDGEPSGKEQEEEEDKK